MYFPKLSVDLVKINVIQAMFKKLSDDDNNDHYRYPQGCQMGQISANWATFGSH